MKSVLVVLIASFGMSALAAQTSVNSMKAPVATFNSNLNDGPLHIVPTLGMAAMTLRSGDGATGGDTGLSLGSLIDFGNHSLTLETGLLYNQFGGKSGSTKFNFSYFSIPMVAKWNVLGTQEQTIYLKGGLMPSILVSGEMKTENETVGSSAIGARPVDFAMLFGVGGTYPIASSTSLVFDVSYVRGLTEVTDKASFRNEGFVFSSGVSIAL